jgi:hypothetical protein
MDLCGLKESDNPELDETILKGLNRGWDYEWDKPAKVSYSKHAFFLSFPS